MSSHAPEQCSKEPHHWLLYCIAEHAMAYRKAQLAFDRSPSSSAIVRICMHCSYGNVCNCNSAWLSNKACSTASYMMLILAGWASASSEKPNLAALQSSAQQPLAVHMGCPAGPGTLQLGGKAGSAGTLQPVLLLPCQHCKLLPPCKGPAARHQHISLLQC